MLFAALKPQLIPVLRGRKLNVYSYNIRGNRTRTFDEIWIPSIIGVLIVASPLLLLKIHSDYKKIAELSKIGVVFAFILFSLFGMAIVNTALFTRWVFARDNILYKIFGYVFMLIGFIIMAEAFVEFRSFKRVASLKADKVISTGVYRFSRNPQYLAYYLLLIGFSVPHRSVFAFILILIHIIFVEVIFISGQERYLEKKLGDEYLQYKKRVNRSLNVMILKRYLNYFKSS